ncbi:MAG: LacI family transcriptional regulator [Myxococcales bacterium]|nr:MAG: LacI family transcriptional regulator [Myxococcales bacterium]
MSFRHLKSRPLLVSVFVLGALGAAACDSGSSSPPPSATTAGTAATTGGTSASAGATGSPATSGSASGGSAGSVNAGGAAPMETDVPAPAEPVSKFIVLDQFGYLPDAEKLAVLRDPEMGFDAADSYVPGAKYQIIDAVTKAVVSELTATAWNNGAVDMTSGDRAWRVDFSALTAPGVYYLLDVDAKVRSDLFRISDDVYRQALRHAFRTFFYQRAGMEKKAEFAGEGWADAASHIGAGQDKNARLFGQTADATTERDLSGGWYDAGDYNRYTAWTADYIVTLLRMYEETPTVFGDDFGLPESGNGQSDLLDEVRFGLTHLARTQSESGGCISVLGVASGSPPSAATGASVYGPESTNATIRAGIAFAWASRLFRASDAAFADELLGRAKKTWEWAEANPAVEFKNTGKVAAGEQQSSEKEVGLFKLGLAVALYRADTAGGLAYKTYFDANYAASGLSVLNGYNAAWELQLTELFLDYTAAPTADAGAKKALVDAFANTIASADNLGALAGDPDPYLAHVADYTWGSNSHKARTGSLQYDVISFGIDAAKNAEARRAAERYLHYIHGVNPLGLVYLSNMGPSGAYKSAATFYHMWFVDKSPRWDEVGVSMYGPPPGFLVGGPNPSYSLDAVCPGNAACPAAPPSPPSGQPPQKSYASFNDNWPVNSWAVTENSNGYQVAYLRLLAKFVR